jgi:SAM-dependent methyltransferase
VGLIEHFQIVRASDLSFSQVALGKWRAGIFFVVEQAESSALPGGSVDLITVAQAIHWFNLPQFFRQVQRVLKPGGILAAWCYQIPKITPKIDQLMEWYFQHVLGPFWTPGIHHVAEGYRNLPFPFQELSAPVFKMITQWNREQLLGFLASWSATKKFITQRGFHPLSEVEPAITHAWGQAQDNLSVQFPLSIRIGVTKRVESSLLY